MKKLLVFVTLVFTTLLGACGLIEEVNNSLNYTNEALNHIDRLSHFAEDAQMKMGNAVSNPETLNELEQQIAALKTDVEKFNEIDPQIIAEGVHGQIVDLNNKLLTEIDAVMENGELYIDKLQNSPIFNTINELTKMKNLIESIG